MRHLTNQQHRALDQIGSRRGDVKVVGWAGNGPVLRTAKGHLIHLDSDGWTSTIRTVDTVSDD
jgi:hypothetical protein